MISDGMKRKLMAATSAGSIAIAGVLASHFEPGKTRGKPYVDPVGVLTVCDGYTGPDIDPSGSIRTRSVTRGAMRILPLPTAPYAG